MGEIRFGLNVSPSAAAGTDPIAAALQAERLGFDFVSVNDHLHGPDPRHETWTLPSWIAASTTRIGVATRVLGVPYRPPAVTAKIAETLDRLSGGRLILGLGGGASDEEFRAFGLRVPSPREKIDGLDEAIRIIRGLWSEREFSFGGRLYRTEEARVEPKPNRRIPIWVGTFGPRGLALAGRLANGWIPSLELAPPEMVTAMRDRVLTAARDAGRDWGEITCVYNLEVRVDERARAEPLVVNGEPGRVVDQLLAFTRLGFTAFNFIATGPGEDEQAERLGRDVMPAVRSAM